MWWVVSQPDLDFICKRKQLLHNDDVHRQIWNLDKKNFDKTRRYGIGCAQCVADTAYRSWWWLIKVTIIGVQKRYFQQSNCSNIASFSKWLNGMLKKDIVWCYRRMSHENFENGIVKNVDQSQFVANMHQINQSQFQ